MRTQINDLEKFIDFLKGKNLLFHLTLILYFCLVVDSANAAAAAMSSTSDKKDIEPYKSSNKSKLNSVS
jgi:hypothetical protein